MDEYPEAEGKMTYTVHNIQGQRFGCLTAIRFDHGGHGKGKSRYKSYWLCHCDCGKDCFVERYNLIRKYDLDLLRQDPVNGLIYGFNDRFRDLSKEEKQIRSTPERRIAELKRIQFSNYPEPVRKKLGEAVEAYQKLLDDKLEAFYERNNILMWDFSRNMPKGPDDEEQETED